MAKINKTSKDRKEEIEEAKKNDVAQPKRFGNANDIPVKEPMGGNIGGKIK